MAEYRIEHLTKRFAIGGRQLEVLRELDLFGDTVEITVILGRSGCGKTTLLKVLCGLEQPDEGSFTLADGAVTVNFSIAQILKGGEFQPQQRPLGSQVSVPDVLQDR